MLLMMLTISSMRLLIKSRATCSSNNTRSVSDLKVPRARSSYRHCCRLFGSSVPLWASAW
jgi:hypothetical protein